MSPAVRAALIVGLAGLVPALPALAAPQRGRKNRAEAHQHRALVALLDAPHAKVKRAELDRIGPAVPALLRRIAAAEGPTRRRLGAISVAGHYRRHAAWLCGLAASSTASIPRRRAAIGACARAGHDGGLAVLGSLLADPKLYIREASVYGLGARCAPAGLQLLRAHRKREKATAVRAAIDAVLQSRCRTPRTKRPKRRRRAEP